MLSGLNIIKPISSYQAAIAKRCGWRNLETLPLKKNILPEGFVGTAKPEPNVLSIGTKLNPNNVTIMELILGNEKLAKSPFVRSNMTEILKASNTITGSLEMQKLLNPSTIDKLDTMRTLVKKHPNDYIKDKTIVKYMATPAGLTSLFKDLNLLKAAYVLDKDALKLLLKKDITQGKGLEILSSIGNRGLLELDSVKGIFYGQNLSVPAEHQLKYFSK